jgi:hypothetical protein
MDSERRELEQRSFDLASQITSTQHKKTKDLLIAEKSSIDLKIQHLRNLQDQKDEEEYADKTEEFILEQIKTSIREAWKKLTPPEL